MPGRTQQRAQFDGTTRTALLEGDVDELEMGMEDIRRAMGTQTKLLTGILVSVTTASILLAVNVLVSKAG